MIMPLTTLWIRDMTSGDDHASHNPGGLGGRQKFFCAPYSNRGAADITRCFTKHDICIQENGHVLHLPF